MSQVQIKVCFNCLRNIVWDGARWEHVKPLPGGCTRPMYGPTPEVGPDDEKVGTLDSNQDERSEARYQHLAGLLGQVLQQLQLLQDEVRKLMTQDEQLTQAVTDLKTATDNNAAAIAAEIAAIKAQPAAASDPVVAAAIANIEAIVASQNAATAAAQAAIAPAVPATPAPATSTATS